MYSGAAVSRPKDTGRTTIARSAIQPSWTGSSARLSAAISATAAVGLYGLITASVALIAADSLALEPIQLGWMALLAIVVLPVSFGLLTAAPLYIPAAEVGLVVLLETVLGPLWVWMAMGEEPGANALAGGAIVILALVMNFALARRSLAVRPIPETAP
jgi:drug/metabolite transporter (DMT)-like permease